MEIADEAIAAAFAFEVGFETILLYTAGTITFFLLPTSDASISACSLSPGP